MAARKEKKMSEEVIEKKMMSFNNTQESVQGLSLWIMHNKAHHQKIVDTWLKVLKKSENKHKLTLFYLCNDVVQHAKKKKALYYLENFKDNLREAVHVIRELDSIKPNIGRIFKIWEDRRTYEAKFIKELRGILAGESESGGNSSKNSSANVTPITPAPVSPAPAYKPSSKDTKQTDTKTDADASSRILEEFKPSKFVDQISSLKRQESEVSLKTKQLTSLRIDATNIEAVKQLKDRSHGNEFCKQFEESCNKIEDYVMMLEKEIKLRKHVLSFCDDAETFYDEQFSEARIVANAYKNFGARISNMKKRVDDMKKIIPSTPSPVPSPSADAPSPGNTPPLQDMDDNDMVDMDLSEDEDDTPKSADSRGTVMPGRVAYTAMVKSIAQPIASLTNITVGEKDTAASEPYNPETPAHEPEGSNMLESRIATMLPNLTKGNSSLGLQMPAGNQPAPVRDYTPIPAASQPSQPPAPIIPDYVPPKIVRQEVCDDRASTPVMDEQEEKEPAPSKTPPKAKTPPAAKIKTNPIDFLSQLLTKTSNTSSSSNFLHSLSLLTNTVKNQYQKQQQQQNSAEEADKGNMSTSSAAPVSAEQSSAFSAVPPPEPITQTSTWSAWKNVNTPVQPPLPQQPEPPALSPPVLPITKTPDLPPQPPLPPEPAGPRQAPLPPQYPAQPPSPVDFSLPPPATPVSRPYIPPPPISQPYAAPPPTNMPAFPSQVNTVQPPNMRPFSPRVSVSQSLNARPFPLQGSTTQSFSQQASSAQSFTSQGASSLVTSTALRPQGPGSGYNPTFRFGIAPPEPRGPAPPAPVLNTNSQPPPPLGFMQGAQNAWDQSRSAVADNAPPNNQSHMPGPFAPPPPPPPDTSAPIPSWQQDPLPPHHPQGQQQIRGYGNQISAVSASRSEWNPPGNTDYEDHDPWEQQDADDDDQSARYAHPWDQPQNYEGEEEDNDAVEELAPSPLPPAPKSILRNSRSSSLREVILVDDSNSNNNIGMSSQNFLPQEPSFVTAGEKKPPAGILKKPPIDITPVIPVSDVQSEFIAKLKQKSGGGPNETPPPLSNRNFALGSSEESVNASLGDFDSSGQGEPISTIGVIGSNGRTSSVKSDDMDIDNDEPDSNYDASSTNDWTKETDESGWGEEDIWKEERQQISNEYDRGGPRLRDPEPYVRPMAPRPYGGYDNYQSRGYHPRPQQFQDQYRGPSPAKRPYFSPRPRMPYYRY